MYGNLGGNADSYSSHSRGEQEFFYFIGNGEFCKQNRGIRAVLNKKICCRRVRPGSHETEENNMLDLKFVRENPEAVKQNIRNKFQESKLPLVDEVIALDTEHRKVLQEMEALRAERNRISKQIGGLMAQGKKEEAEETKKKVTEFSSHLAKLEEQEKAGNEKITKIMMTIPNIIDPSVPIGKDDSENVDV